MLQFTSGGHVLGFTSKDVYVATGSHALRVELVGATGVAPVTDGAAAVEWKASPLGRVSYPNVWEGISLSYEAGYGGIVRSTYLLASGADPEQIRLRYSAPVTLKPDGSLRVAAPSGWMSESAPVAWQNRDGLQVPVPVSFHAVSERVVGFTLGTYDKNLPVVIDPTMSWNTFLGSSSVDYGEGVAVDGSGNIYVTGRSGASWGTPVLPFSIFDDAFVAKLNSSGVLQWITFLGSSSAYASAAGIAVDGGTNVYVIGTACASWGTPLQAFSGVYDVFVAKLDTSGVLQWNTFLGSYQSSRPIPDAFHGIAVDGGGNIFVAGKSYASWGSNPVAPFTGSSDAFVAKLSTAGILQWNTFLGSSSTDYARALALDDGGNIYLTGLSASSWGSPMRAHSGSSDNFVAKLNASGVLQWNSFLGSSDWEQPGGIAVDSGGNAYVTGQSFATWGSPMQAFSGYVEAFAAKLNTSGVLQWNTFLGSAGDDRGQCIAVARSGKVYVTGGSDATWGLPEQAFSGNKDVFMAELSAAGVVQWNSFLGSGDIDEVRGIALDGGGNILITGESFAPWGSPFRPWSGAPDAFVAAVPVSTGPPNTPPTDITLSGSSVPENEAAGRTVGDFGTVDAEGSPFTYELVPGAGGDDNAFFTVHVTDGILRTNAVFDRESKSTYNIRVRSTDAGGYFLEKAFVVMVTDVTGPAATMLGVVSLSTSGATLTGEVNPGGLSTTAWFEWGTNPSLASPTLTDPVDLGAGTGALPVSFALDSLDSGVTYYYRVVAQNTEGTTRGSIDYFAPEPADTGEFVVNSADDVESPPPGKLTLRAAVSRIDPFGVITFDQRLDGTSIDLSIVGETDTILKGEVFTMDAGKWVFQGYQERNYGKSALYADKSLTIDASALPHGITLAWTGGDASHARVLAVYGHLTMKKVTVKNGYSAADPLPGNTAQPYTLGRGGGIAVWGAATLVDCVLAGNRAVGDTTPSRDRGTFGGGIYADTVDLTGCVVSGNSVTGYGGSGGGVFSVGGAGTWTNSNLRRSAVTGNRVTAQHAYGGGVYSDGGGPGNLMTMTIDSCTIARNLVEDNPDIDQSAMTQYYYRGGGFYMSNGILNLSSSTIVENAVTGVAAIFSGKPNMGGGGIAATIGNAHVVESMDIWHSIVAGNTLAGAPSDIFTGSLLDFYSSGYNLFGTIDFSMMLVPVPSWYCLSRRHYPQVGDQDGVSVGAVLDLGNVRRHDTIESVGTDAGSKAVLWYPPQGIALDWIPADSYYVPVVWVGYDPVNGESPVDDFPYLVLEKLRTYQGGVLGPDFGTGLGDLSAVIWYPEPNTWPSDPRNAPWISFWRSVDAEIGDRLGTVRLGDEFWDSFEDGLLGENITMTVMRYEKGPIPMSQSDQLSATRFATAWGDVGAVESNLPPVLTLGTPSGPILTATPTYTWNARPGIDSYLLWVGNGTIRPVYQWYTADAAGCGSGIGTCSVTPAATLSPGAWSFNVKGRNVAGTGSWAYAQAFTFVSIPTVLTLVTPSGPIGSAAPTYTWSAQSGVDSYLLWVGNGTIRPVYQWYTAAAAGCGSGTGTCSVTPAATLSPGAWSFNVKGRNVAGTGPWAYAKAFTLVSTPTVLTLGTPSGPIATATPTYTWSAQAGVESYLLWVGNGTIRPVYQWYTAAAAGCGSGTGTCSVTPAATLSPGAWSFNVKGRNVAGTGPWAYAKAFTLVSTPTVLTLGTPSGPIGTATPTYTWSAQLNVDSYQLWVGNGTTTPVYQWYTAAAAGCGSGTGTCSVTPAAALAPGSWSFNVKGRNVAGTGPWAYAKAFTYSP